VSEKTRDKRYETNEKLIDTKRTRRKLRDDMRQTIRNERKLIDTKRTTRKLRNDTRQTIRNERKLIDTKRTTRNERNDIRQTIRNERKLIDTKRTNIATIRIIIIILNEYTISNTTIKYKGKIRHTNTDKSDTIEYFCNQQ
jgi:vacuolar-type H+-ATPase subunit I/STV1